MRALVLALLCCPAAVLAQSAETGRAIYETYCATCHGPEARGDGPMSKILLVPPPDLTRLAERNDGVFPTAWVAARIDGRDPVISHGGEMPVWGGLFEGNMAAIASEYGQPILTSETIADLVGWLETVQR